MSQDGARAEPLGVLYVHYGEDWLRGSERVLLDLIAGVDRQRFRPVVWCNSPVLAEEVARLGIPVERGPFAYYSGYGPPGLRPAALAGQIREGRRLIRRHRIGLVHVNSAAPAQWMIPACWLSRRPCLVHLHAPYLKRPRYTALLHHANKVVGVSRAVIGPLLADGMPPAAVAVVANGVDPRRLEGGDRRGLRRTLGIPPTARVCALVGALVAFKRHDLAIAAMKEIAAGGGDLWCLFVGEGPLRASLEQAAGGLPIRFLGACSDVGAILRDACDFIILPSDNEAFGLVILEAASQGLPCIGTDSGGVPEVIEDGRSGLLVAKGDAPALAGAMRRLADDPALCASLGEGARRLAATRGVEPMIEGIERCYEALIGAHKAPPLRLRPLASLAGLGGGRR
ncbi:glycosyltransferase family 4 protein [Rhodospirillum rubrum]|uniref:glycosyltransferase family 4 protein n=1 Tax=Rhodospirillum rubrum TaxID=1085 RepID=UPI0019037FBF|nr:glycosyltransferase family 4 protein [Rhodospirillum rubrum]